MDKKYFKKFFSELALNKGFKNAFQGWFLESNECILILFLQKSNYENSYYLNLKVFIQGIFNKNYVINENLIKKETGNIFRREPKEYAEAFNFEIELDDASRKQKFISLFDDFILPFAEKALTRFGIKELANAKQINLLPAVKNELEQS